MLMYLCFPLLLPSCFPPHCNFTGYFNNRGSCARRLTGEHPVMSNKGVYASSDSVFISGAVICRPVVQLCRLAGLRSSQSLIRLISCCLISEALLLKTCG